MIEPGPGILLIAEPFLKDPNFFRTVVFLCEHKKEGSFGFVLNRKIENTVDELMPELDGIKLPVFYGGPVQLNSIHFLHQYPDIIPGGEEVMKGVYWGGEFDRLIEALKKNEIESSKIRFFIGYSGWGDGQLSNEMKEKTWLTVKATRKLVFNENHNNTWKDSIRHLGGEYKQIINYPIDPQLN